MARTMREPLETLIKPAELVGNGVVVEIIKEHKVRPNKDLILAMEFIKKDFDIIFFGHFWTSQGTKKILP